MFCGFFGRFFSFRFFHGQVTKELYIEKNLIKNTGYVQGSQKHKFSQVDPVNGNPIDPETGGANDEITDKFMRIKMTSMQMFFDPYFSFLEGLFKDVAQFGLCKRRSDIVRKATERMNDEFDVVKMMKKIRLSNDLWNNVLQKDQQKLMKFQKSGVIDLDASDISEVSSIESENTEETDNGEYDDPQSNLEMQTVVNHPQHQPFGDL